MKFPRFFAAFMLVLSWFGGAVEADDIFPPAWRGASNTTFQQWDFTTDTSLNNYSLVNSPANAVTNLYGVPLLNLNCGNFGSGWYDNSDLSYSFLWSNKQGFWDIGDGSVSLQVPNLTNSHSKIVELQITYFAGVNYSAPIVSISPTATPIGSPTNLILTAPIGGDSWVLTKYLWQISSSPASETITIQAGGNFGSIIDQVILETQITNNTPVISSYTVSRTAGLSQKIFWTDLTNQWSDADGDSLRLASLSSSSTNGVTITTNGIFVFYPQSAPSVNDRINYQVTDALGTTVSGVINLVVNPFVTGTNTVSITLAGNPTLLHASGIPGLVYAVERSTNLLSWTSISTNTASVSGSITVSDNFSDLGGNAPGSAYYRVKWTGN